MQRDKNEIRRKNAWCMIGVTYLFYIVFKKLVEINEIDIENIEIKYCNNRIFW